MIWPFSTIANLREANADLRHDRDYWRKATAVALAQRDDVIRDLAAIRRQRSEASRKAASTVRQRALAKMTAANSNTAPADEVAGDMA